MAIKTISTRIHGTATRKKCFKNMCANITYILISTIEKTRRFGIALTRRCFLNKKIKSIKKKKKDPSK